MATYSKGINGPFRGKVGTVIGSSWKGIDYMKSRPRKKNDKPSVAQLDQREKFKTIGNFMKKMTNVVLLGFNKNLPGDTGYNNATAYALKNALDTTTSPLSIRYSKVLVTRGEYPNDDNLTAKPGLPGRVLFQWQNITGLGVAKADDKVVLVAYSPLSNAVIFTCDIAVRSDGKATLNLENFKGQIVETYISFLKADGTDVSSSFYTGQVVVAA
jgi:hypothetical protein